MRMVTRCVHQGLPGFWLPTSFRVPLWAFAATRTSVHTGLQADRWWGPTAAAAAAAPLPWSWAVFG